MKASRTVLAAVTLALGASGAMAAPRVVADEACPYYAVDVQSFASCEGESVASSATLDPVAWLETEQVPASKRTRAGLYLDARGAYGLKLKDSALVVLVDVRSRLEAGMTGQPRPIDLHVPYQEVELPLQWDERSGGWALAANPEFLGELVSRLRDRGAAEDTVIILICRSGETSARAADLLEAAGYPQAVTVVDGFEGDVGADGRRLVNGWKNAGLPWSASADRLALSGERLQ